MYTIVLDATNLLYFDYQNIERINDYSTKSIIFHEADNIVRFCLENIISDNDEINIFETFLKSIVSKCGLKYIDNKYIPIYKNNEILVFTKESIFKFQYENIKNIKVTDLLPIIFNNQ